MSDVRLRMRQCKCLVGNDISFQLHVDGFTVRYFRGHLEVRKNVKPRKNICDALHHKRGQILRRQQQYF